ncbi:hypothetical protein L596_019540 [Steinernema carpocapsae]|uniref:J domain-containing protein n=1 Tax=Steinernema carpocapsae TaxID=34508 RepID=A0A4U5MQU4_STECR|nr:hypothetical protein L596_019540 [Steinernema carpocapsae]
MSKKPSTIDYDPYELLGLEKEADASAVKKGYRKAALKWHPDKNPDPKAAETFRKVQEAFELLADETARAAYDHVVAAKAAKKAFVAERRANDNAKRRKFREDLEKREAAATDEDEEAKAARELAREIARLRKEGSRLLDEENERLRRKMEAEEDENRRRRHAAQAKKPTTSSAPRKAFGTTHEEFDAFEAAILAQMNAPTRKRPAANDVGDVGESRLDSVHVRWR